MFHVMFNIILAIFFIFHHIQSYNCIVTNDKGEVVIIAKSAKVQGFLPHSYSPVNSDPARLLTPENLNPIIIVPDTRRSTLEATVLKSEHSLKFCKNKWDYYPIWFKVSNFRPFAIDCWASNFRMHYDAKERKSFSTPGVHVRPKNFGSASEVEHTIPKLRGPKNYFMHLIESLIGMGYVRDHNLMSATYDWRIAPYENEEFKYFFKKLLEVTYSMNNNKPAIVICHGVGCLYVHHFLTNMDEQQSSGESQLNQQQAPRTKRSPENVETDFKAKYVKAMIAITVPWGGYFNGLYSYLNHDNEQLFKSYPIIKAVERTFSSTSYLLPTMDVFGKDALIQTQFRNYTSNDYKDVFLGLGYPNAFNMYIDGLKYSSKLDHPMIDTFVISGLGYKTMESIVYKTAIDLSDTKNLYKRCRRRIIYGNGDGIVNLKSARRVLLWQNDPHGYKFTYTEFLAKHDDILKNTHAISHILNIVSSLKFAPDLPNVPNTGGNHEYHSEYSSGGGHHGEHHGSHGDQNAHGPHPEPEPYAPSSAHSQGQMTYVDHHRYPGDTALSNNGNYSLYYHPPGTPTAPISYVNSPEPPRSSSTSYIDSHSYNRRPIIENNISISATERLGSNPVAIPESKSDITSEKVQASAGYIANRSHSDPILDLNNNNNNNNFIEQSMLAQESINYGSKVNVSDTMYTGNETSTARTLLNVLFDISTDNSVKAK